MTRSNLKLNGATMRRQTRAFSLVEMLVVIAVIGVIAALVVGGASHFRETSVRGRVSTELNQVTAAIESYHKNYGFYPQDNRKGADPDPSHNPLFYELTGDFYKTFSSAVPDWGNEFNIKGVVNSGADSKNFFPNIGIAGKNFSTNPPVMKLIAGYRGPAGDVNPWRYVSKNPTNNTETYDLWAEVVVGNKKIVIGNWKD